MCKVIDDIYQKIIKFGRDTACDTIYVGIIFNVIFVQISLKEANEMNNELNKENNNITLVPIFKIKTKMRGIWYIDNEGRTYKTWKDYVTNNTLPQCTMILPKGGLYQCNPNDKVTEYNSTVWIEILDSPACTVKNKVLKNVDIATNTLAICSLGIGAASIFTPVGPVVLTAGLIYNGISGIWTVARNSQKLVDRVKHNQSVNPINKTAFPAWLDIAGSVLTLGASGGTVVMSKAITRGSTIGAAAKIAYNSMLLGNLTVGGIGIVYKSYDFIYKYQMESKVDFLDIVMFASNVLFFSNVVISTKLAGELIGSSKGTIFENFKTTLRRNRLKKEFNKMNANSSSNEQTDSQGIIYDTKKIVNKEHFLNLLCKMKNKIEFPVIYKNNNIVINNKIFLDPLQFAGHLLTVGRIIFNLTDSRESVTLKERNDHLIKLKVLLQRLLKEFFVDKEYSNEQLPDISYFNDILQEMKYMNNPVDILIKCFKISTLIAEHCNEPGMFLCDAIYFSWIYCKANLKIYNVNIASTSKHKILDTILSTFTIVSSVHWSHYHLR
ncbi:hypothetical protein WN48_10763, partial [Eufriesea mexicana]